jgi:hypothetical protein
MQDTFLLSTGIIMDGLAVNLDRKTELAKCKGRLSWRSAREDFGTEQGLQTRDWILDAIHYE